MLSDEEDSSSASSDDEDSRVSPTGWLAELLDATTLGSAASSPSNAAKARPLRREMADTTRNARPQSAGGRVSAHSPGMHKRIGTFLKDYERKRESTTPNRRYAAGWLRKRSTGLTPEFEKIGLTKSPHNAARRRPQSAKGRIASDPKGVGTVLAKANEPRRNLPSSRRDLQPDEPQLDRGGVGGGSRGGRAGGGVVVNDVGLPRAIPSKMGTVRMRSFQSTSVVPSRSVQLYETFCLFATSVLIDDAIKTAAIRSPGATAAAAAVLPAGAHGAAAAQKRVVARLALNEVTVKVLEKLCRGNAPDLKLINWVLAKSLDALRADSPVAYALPQFLEIVRTNDLRGILLTDIVSAARCSALLTSDQAPTTDPDYKSLDVLGKFAVVRRDQKVIDFASVKEVIDTTRWSGDLPAKTELPINPTTSLSSKHRTAMATCGFGSVINERHLTGLKKVLSSSDSLNTDSIDVLLGPCALTIGDKVLCGGEFSTPFGATLTALLTDVRATLRSEPVDNPDDYLEQVAGFVNEYVLLYRDNTHGPAVSELFYYVQPATVLHSCGGLCFKPGGIELGKDQCEDKFAVGRAYADFTGVDTPFSNWSSYFVIGQVACIQALIGICTKYANPLLPNDLVSLVSWARGAHCSAEDAVAVAARLAAVLSVENTNASASNTRYQMRAAIAVCHKPRISLADLKTQHLLLRPRAPTFAGTFWAGPEVAAAVQYCAAAVEVAAPSPISKFFWKPLAWNANESLPVNSAESLQCWKRVANIHVNSLERMHMSGSHPMLRIECPSRAWFLNRINDPVNFDLVFRAFCQFRDQYERLGCASPDEWAAQDAFRPCSNVIAAYAAGPISGGFHPGTSVYLQTLNAVIATKFSVDDVRNYGMFTMEHFDKPLVECMSVPYAIPLDKVVPSWAGLFEPDADATAAMRAYVRDLIAVSRMAKLPILPTAAPELGNSGAVGASSVAAYNPELTDLRRELRVISADTKKLHDLVGLSVATYGMFSEGLKQIRTRMDRIEQLQDEYASDKRKVLILVERYQQQIEENIEMFVRHIKAFKRTVSGQVKSLDTKVASQNATIAQMTIPDASAGANISARIDAIEQNNTALEALTNTIRADFVDVQKNYRQMLSNHSQALETKLNGQIADHRFSIENSATAVAAEVSKQNETIGKLQVEFQGILTDFERVKTASSTAVSGLEAVRTEFATVKKQVDVNTLTMRDINDTVKELQTMKVTLEGKVAALKGDQSAHARGPNHNGQSDLEYNIVPLEEKLRRLEPKVGKFEAVSKALIALKANNWEKLRDPITNEIMPALADTANRMIDETIVRLLAERRKQFDELMNTYETKLEDAQEKLSALLEAAESVIPTSPLPAGGGGGAVTGSGPSTLFPSGGPTNPPVFNQFSDPRTRQTAAQVRGFRPYPGDTVFRPLSDDETAVQFVNRLKQDVMLDFASMLGTFKTDSISDTPIVDPIVDELSDMMAPGFAMYMVTKLLANPGVYFGDYDGVSAPKFAVGLNVDMTTTIDFATAVRGIIDQKYRLTGDQRNQFSPVAFYAAAVYWIQESERTRENRSERRQLRFGEEHSPKELIPAARRVSTIVDAIDGAIVGGVTDAAGSPTIRKYRFERFVAAINIWWWHMKAEATGGVVDQQLMTKWIGFAPDSVRMFVRDLSDCFAIRKNPNKDDARKRPLPRFTNPHSVLPRPLSGFRPTGVTVKALALFEYLGRNSGDFKYNPDELVTPNLSVFRLTTVLSSRRMTARDTLAVCQWAAVHMVAQALPNPNSQLNVTFTARARYYDETGGVEGPYTFRGTNGFWKAYENIHKYAKTVAGRTLSKKTLINALLIKGPMLNWMKRTRAAQERSTVVPPLDLRVRGERVGDWLYEMCEGIIADTQQGAAADTTPAAYADIPPLDCAGVVRQHVRNRTLWINTAEYGSRYENYVDPGDLYENTATDLFPNKMPLCTTARQAEPAALFSGASNAVIMDALCSVFPVEDGAHILTTFDNTTRGRHDEDQFLAGFRWYMLMTHTGPVKRRRRAKLRFSEDIRRARTVLRAKQQSRLVQGHAFIMSSQEQNEAVVNMLLAAVNSNVVKAGQSLNMPCADHPGLEFSFYRAECNPFTMFLASQVTVAEYDPPGNTLTRDEILSPVRHFDPQRPSVDRTTGSELPY